MSDEILKKLLEHAEDQKESSVETQKCIAKLDKKLDLHIQATNFELTSIKEEDQIQNKLLKEHMSGVNTLKDIRDTDKKEINRRLTRMEDDKKFWKKLKSILMAVSAVAVALSAIAVIFGLFK